MCFTYMLENYVSAHSVEKLYQIFGTEEGSKLLKKHKLLQPCSNMYSSPLEMLHDTLSDGQKSEYLYHWWGAYKALEPIRDMVAAWTASGDIIPAGQ